MQSDSFVEGAASVAAVAAAAAVLYSRASARAARDAVAAAERTVRLAEVSRQAAHRAQLRRRLERVGELVQQIVAASSSEVSTDGLSERAKMQCHALSRALVGLVDFLPRSAELSRATTAGELSERADRAGLEIDAALRKLARYRQQSTYRPRHVAPWHRPSRARSAAVSGGEGSNHVTRPPTP